jgi:hypothetical protein
MRSAAPDTALSLGAMMPTWASPVFERLRSPLLMVAPVALSCQPLNPAFGNLPG